MRISGGTWTPIKGCVKCITHICKNRKGPKLNILTTFFWYTFTLSAVREVCLKWKSVCMLLHCNVQSEAEIEIPLNKKYMKSQQGMMFCTETQWYIHCKKFRYAKQFCGTSPFGVTMYSPNQCQTRLWAEQLASSLVPSVETGLFQDLCHVCWCGSWNEMFIDL